MKRGLNRSPSRVASQASPHEHTHRQLENRSSMQPCSFGQLHSKPGAAHWKAAATWSGRCRETAVLGPGGYQIVLTQALESGGPGFKSHHSHLETIPLDRSFIFLQ